jgi:Neurotransmitter-gated ion-channel ligand binding domain
MHSCTGTLFPFSPFPLFPFSPLRLILSSFHLPQSWQDNRLSYGQFSNISAALLPLGVTVLQKIWKPDTTVYNGKHSYFHDITSPNKFVRIYRDGRLMYSQRYGSLGHNVIAPPPDVIDLTS